MFMSLSPLFDHTRLNVRHCWQMKMGSGSGLSNTRPHPPRHATTCTSISEVIVVLVSDAHPARHSAQKVVIVTRGGFRVERSEEHTSELQSRFDLVCRLLLEKKY